MTVAPKPGRQGMVKLGQRVRKLSRLQMYQRQYYKPKWAAVCETRWREYLKEPEEEGVKKKARLTFVNELCTQFLEEEEDEVKKEIDLLMERQAKGEKFLSEPAVEGDSGAVDETAATEKVKAINETLTMWNELVRNFDSSEVSRH